MARIRSVHPDLHRDKTLALASASAERTFVRLWCHLDDDGRGEDDLELLKADLYPRHRDMTADVIDSDLRELESLGLVIRYEADDMSLIACKPTTWAKYQKPQKKTDSDLPPPPDTPTVPLQDQGDTATEPVAPVVGGEKEGEKEAASEPEVSDVAHELCRVFAIEHCKRNSHGVPSEGSQARRKWLVEMDRLVRIGPPNVDNGVDPERVRHVILGMAEDTGDGSFPGWSSVCGSVPKFREKFTQISAAVDAKNRNTNGARASPPRDRHDPTPYQRPSRPTT